MNPKIKNLINVTATGIFVTVIFSLVLFWGRHISYSKLIKHTPPEFFRVAISPSGLVPGEPAPQREWSGRTQISREEPNEPNFLFSEVYASLDFDRVANFVYPVGSIGFLWDLTDDIMLYRDVNERIYYWYDVKTGEYCCLDKRSGLIVNCRGYRGNAPGRIKIELFAGPNGVSGTPEPSLGRFYDPIVGEDRYSSRIGLYDRQMRRFYKIDFINGNVRKGPELSEGDDREPVAVGRISKHRLMWLPQLEWFPHRVKDINDNWQDQRMPVPESNKPNEEWWYEYFGYTDRKYTTVLDKGGRIYILDTNEWSMKDAGYLPVPRSLFSSENRNAVADTRDLLGYEVRPIYKKLMEPTDESKRGWRAIDVKYLGMVVACVSREGTAMAVAVFDSNGRLIERADTGDNGWSSDEAIYGKPYESFWAPVEYILENLQPPVFEVATYLSGDYFEAEAGHRALFILPNSFLGMLGRADVEDYLAKLIFALVLLMGPSLILAGWLARKVWKDAKLIGLSSRAGKWWIAGTIAFGLPAYITYRLTKTKETLVTCQNCGKMRRPDMERCHRCGSKWEMPELTPPSWRICD